MHETAIVVGVPKAERLFGRWRRLYTQDGRDGMGAHVTLLYPFADDARVDSDLPQVRSVLGHFSPFVCSFRGTARFPEDGVLYLRPEPDEIFRAMTDALAQAFPLHPPYGGAYGDLVPHLTVAQSADADLVDAIENDVRALLPFETRVAGASVMHFVEAIGWRERASVPLT